MQRGTDAHPLDENQARILSKTSGDIVDSGDIIPPPDKIPPPEREENHAQIASDIDQSGDSGHSGGIIRLSGE